MRIKQSFWRIYLAVGFVTAVSVAALLSLSMLGSHVVKHHAAYMVPCIELDKSVFNARLILDEMLAGDESHQISEVIEEIESAERCVGAMLEGGRGKAGQRLAVKDEGLRGLLKALQGDLALFRVSSQKRVEYPVPASGDAAYIDYHDIFARIIRNTRKIESRAHDVFLENTRRMQLLERFMVAGTFLIAVAGGLLLRSGLHKIRRGEKELGDANRHLTEAELSLRKVSERNESILATVPEIIMEVDRNKVYTWANESGYEFFGRDVIGKEAADYFEGEQMTYKNVEPLFRGGEDVIYLESWQRRFDGAVRLLAWWCRVKKDSDGNVIGALSTARDITEENVSREEREATINLLKIMNKAGSKHELFNLITVFMKEWSGCEAVGIRLQDGGDFPYFETAGLPEDFVQKETCLCEVDDKGDIVLDEGGNPVLECMCGNIIRGRFDSSLPFFTKHGSFWTNSTTDLLASTNEEDRQARTRNRCHGVGYESVALIPLRHQGEVLGLLQFNDRRRDRFSEGKIAYLENIAWNLAVGISQRMMQEQLAESEKKYRSLVDSAPDVIMRFDRECRHIFVSHSVEKVVSGMKPADFIGKTHHELGFPAEQCAMWEKAIKKVFDTGAPFESEFKFENDHGVLVFDWRLIPEISEAGKVVTVLSIARDLTEHRAADVAYKSIFNQMLDGMAVHEMIWDDKGEPVDYRFITINPAFEQMTGLKLADVAGKTVKDVLPLTEEDWIKTYGKVVKTGEPAHFESYSAGLSKHFEVTAYRNAPNQFTVICMDVSATKKAEDALSATQFRLEKAQEIGNLGSWDMDILANKIYWTDENYRLFGLEIGTPLTYEVFENCVHPEDREAVNRAWAASLEGAPYAIDHRVTVGNEIRWLREKAELIFDDKGGVVRAVGFSQDITERIKAEHELRDSEHRYRSIFEGASQGILVIDIETKEVIYVNRAAAEMLGYGIEELKRMNIKDLHPEDEVEQAVDNFAEDAHLAHPQVSELMYMRKDGSVFPAEVTTRVTNVAGRACRIGFLNDISHRKQMELQKEQLIQSDKLASLGTLVAGVAHEINNPNSFIMLNAPNLQDMWDDMMPVLEESCKEKGTDKVGYSDLATLKEIGPKLLGDILKGSERIKKIVSELKLFARQDDAEMRPDVDINAVVESAISLTHNKIKNATNDFKVKYGENIPVVKGNYQRLEQVVINLLINACDALPSRSHGILLETFTDEDRMIVVLRLKDEGAGMTKETLARIKDPFFTTKRDTGGTGLGLSISSGVIAEHEGVLTYESEPGEGTTATVVLPVWVPDPGLHPGL